MTPQDTTISSGCARSDRRGAWFAAALLVAISASIAGAAAADWRRLRIGSEGAHPPFNYLDADNQFQGFEIDLAREVCARLKADCDFVAQDFAGLIPALIANRYDVVFSSLTATPARKAYVLFSNKYYDARAMFVTNKAKPLASTDPKAATGLAFGAKVGSVSARYLQDRYAPNGAKVKLYVTIDEARLDLAEGRLDAVLGDKTAMLLWLEKSPRAQCCQVVGDDLEDRSYFGEGVAAAVRKSDVALKVKIDDALAQIREDGTYERIRKRYFSFDPY